MERPLASLLDSNSEGGFMSSILFMKPPSKAGKQQNSSWSHRLDIALLGILDVRAPLGTLDQGS